MNHPGKPGRVNLLGKVGKVGKLRLVFMQSAGFKRCVLFLDCTAFVNYCTAYVRIMCTFVRYGILEGCQRAWMCGKDSAGTMRML